jgi:CHAD domain-containing protein
VKPSKPVKKYFKKRANAINRLMKKPGYQFSMEDFHELRVEIKKIRALLFLVKNSSKDFKLNKNFKPFKKIFDQAGKIRNIQLEESMLKKRDPRNNLKAYPGELKMRELEEHKYFSALIKKMQPELKKKLQRVKPSVAKINMGDALALISQAKKEITALTKPGKLKPSKVHELRKGLKKYYYYLKSLDVKVQSHIFKNGDRLMEIMGKWHDGRIINRHLLRITKNHKIPWPEIQPIKLIAERLQLKTDALYDVINNLRQKKII